MNEVCLLGHNNYGTDGSGRVSCMTCSEMRARMKERERKNAPAGRHPRETLTRVPNAPLRERFLQLARQGVDTAEVARAAGYVVKTDPRQADTQRLKRQLGITKSSGKRRDSEGQRVWYVADSVTYESAVSLCRALGVEYPSEVGI